MMISPPTDDDPVQVPQQTRDDDWIRQYINVPPWKCSECGTTMFGRMTYCAYCKLRLGIERGRKE